MKARLKDADKVAKEIALSKRPETEEEELCITDQRYQKIAVLAIQRVRRLIDTKDHFLNQVRETRPKRRKTSCSSQLGTKRWRRRTNGWQSQGASSVKDAKSASPSTSK